MSDIKQQVAQLADTYGKSPLQLMVCTVVSVNKKDRTVSVTPVTDNLSAFPAQLMSDVADGVLILPKVGSTVKVMLSEQATPTVVQYSDVDEVFIVTGGSSVKIYSTGIELHGANFGGIPKVWETAERIKRLEDDINTLKQAFTSWVVVPSDGGSALKVAAASWYAAIITPTTTQSYLENTKVKHGNG